MALSRVCLDTSAYSHFKRGEPQAVQLLTEARELVIPAIVLGELRTGFQRSLHSQHNERELRAFLAEPIVSVWAVDEETASVYADIVGDLRAQGRPLPTNDIWIAAVSIRADATIVTYDTHFQAIQRTAARVLRRNA